MATEKSAKRGKKSKPTKNITVLEKFFHSRHTVKFPGDKSFGEYICVNSAREDMQAFKKPGDADITGISAISIDIDYAKDILDDGKIIPTDEELIEYVEEIAIASFVPKFSGLVHSGHGAHVHFVLVSDYPPTEYYRNIRYKITVALIRIFKGDSQAKDLSRILRKPGTLNKKYGLSAQCKIIQDNDITYDIMDLYKRIVGEDLPEDKSTKKPETTDFYSDPTLYENNLKTLVDSMGVGDSDIKLQEVYGDYPSTTKIIFKCIFHNDRNPSAFLRISERSGQIVFYQCTSSSCGKKLVGIEAHRAVEAELGVNLGYDQYEKVREDYIIEDDGRSKTVFALDKEMVVDKKTGKVKERRKKIKAFSTTSMPSPILDKRNKKVYLFWQTEERKIVEKLPGGGAGFGEISMGQFIIDKYEHTARFFTTNATESSEPMGWSKSGEFITCEHDVLSSHMKKKKNDACFMAMSLYLNSDPRIPAVMAFAMSSLLPKGDNNVIFLKGRTTGGKSWLLEIFSQHFSYSIYESTTSTINTIRKSLSENYSCVVVDELIRKDNAKENHNDILYDIFSGIGRGRLKRSGVKRKQEIIKHVSYLAASESLDPSMGSEGMLNRIASFDLTNMVESFYKYKGKDEANACVNLLHSSYSDSLDIFDGMTIVRVNEYLDDAHDELSKIEISNIRDYTYLKNAIAILKILNDRFKLDNYFEAQTLIIEKTATRVERAQELIFERIRDIMNGYEKMMEFKSISRSKLNWGVTHKVFYKNGAWAYLFEDSNLGFTRGNLDKFLRMTEGGNIHALEPFVTMEPGKVRGTRVKKIIFLENEDDGDVEEGQTRTYEYGDSHGNVSDITEKYTDGEWMEVSSKPRRKKK
jgi:hypothetical protein